MLFFLFLFFSCYVFFTPDYSCMSFVYSWVERPLAGVDYDAVGSKTFFLFFSSWNFKRSEAISFCDKGFQEPDPFASQEDGRVRR